MNRALYTLCTLILVVFSTAFTAVDHPTIPLNDIGERWSADSTSLSRRHTEAIKSLTIWHDTVRAERLWREIIDEDNCYAPALYNLSRLRHISPNEATSLAERAYLADSTNKWYCDSYATMLFQSKQIERALPVFKRLLTLDNRQTSTYYYLAYIYVMRNMPFSAIAVLDSADMRIGHNDILARLKQQLLIETGQYDKAVAIGRKVVLESPYDAEARIELARTYEMAKQDSLARQTYEEAYQLDTTRLETSIEILDYHIRNNNISERLRFEEKIFQDRRIPLKIKIDRIDELMSSDIYHSNYFRIGGLLSSLLKHYPTEREIVRIYTIHLCNGGMFEEATNYLRSHLDDENVSAEDFELIALLDSTLERQDLMESDLKRGVQLFKDNITLWDMYSLSKHLQGNTKGAISLMRKALKHVENGEDISTCWGRIGDYYHELKNDKEAFKAYRTALDHNPENVEVLNNYAYYLSLRDEELDKALAMAQLAITLEENNYNYIDTYAWVLHRMGRNVEAKKYMRQALSLCSQRDANLLMHYGDILWALGEEFMADTYWQKSVAEGYNAEEMAEHILEIKSNKR